MHPDHIFKALSKHLERTNKRPGGHGHLVHDGLLVKCAGQPDPDIEGGRIDQHLIGTFQVTPKAKAKGIDVFAVGNKEHDGEFVLDQAQEKLDPANPVCQICGKEPIL